MKRHVMLSVSLGVLLLAAFVVLSRASFIQAQPKPAPATPEAAPLAATVTHTVYLPLVANNYPYSDQFGVGYATGSDRTLIRWFWTKPAEPSAFRVYRKTGSGAETLIATVTPVINPTAAISLLNTTDPRYSNLYDFLITNYAPLGITDIPSFHAVMRANKLAAQRMASDFYPTALVIGWGYLDKAITPGTTYTYRVEAVLPAGAQTLGSVTALAGQLTPLAQPTGLTALTLDDNDPLIRDKAGDWGTAQQNRRFHQTVYLRWDAEQQANSINGPWLTGYDIFRAPITSTTTLSRVNGIQPIQALTATIPISDTPVTTDVLAYETVPYYFADEAPAAGQWVYRVTPRDLLGQIHVWPADQAQFSAPFTARARDFLPPDPPIEVTATVTATGPISTVVLSWQITPTADLSGFIVYRAFAISVTLQTNCVDETKCWREVTRTTALQWHDLDPTLEQVRWYRLQAVDQDGNRSRYTAPVQAILHDVTPPTPPTVSVQPCAETGGQGQGYCITATPTTVDTTRYRLYCQFSADGVMMPLGDTTQINTFKLESVYSPPYPVSNVACQVRAADAHGNLSDPAPFNVPWMLSPRPVVAPTPIITTVNTALGGVNGYSAHLFWDVNDAGGLSGFRIDREAIYRPNAGPVGDVASFIVNDPTVRTFTDASIELQTVYNYTVTALTPPNFPFFGVEASSFPRTFKAVINGQRPLTEVGWVDVTWTAGQGVQLHWDPESDLLRGWAVFRSVRRDSDYIQLTPIVNAGPIYLDASAQHDRYWYVAVEFDLRSGEPIRYTRPRSAAYGTAPAAAALTLDNTPAPENAGLSTAFVSLRPFQASPAALQPLADCAPTMPTAGEPLRFGEGFEVVSVTLDAPIVITNLTGGGYLRLTPPSGDIYIPVNFTAADSISVGDAQNHVCTGQLNVTGAVLPGNVQYPGGLRYGVTAVYAKPWFTQPNPGTGEVQITLPDSLRLFSSGLESDVWPLFAADGLALHGDLSFSMTASLAGFSCAAPALGFNLETLPARVVPLGSLSFDQYGIDAPSSCLQYLDRYSGEHGPRSTSPADSNDGYLRGNYTGGTISVAATGLRGAFSTADSLAWLASYPYRFSVSASGGSIGISGTQIVSGSLGGGAVSLAYHTGLTTTTPAPLSGAFGSLTLDARGAAYGDFSTVQDVAWLNSGFKLFAGDWELYLGELSTRGRPHQAMWATRPSDLRDVGLSQLAEIEPGLNRRLSSAQLYFGNCAGPSAIFDAALNTYVRQGGVSQRQKAKIIAPVSLPIHGYDASLDNLEFEWLDNYIFDRNATGWLNLPAPPNVSLRLVNLWFNPIDGCIDGGMVPPGQAAKTLQYWQIDARFKSVEFRRPLGTADQKNQYHDAMLWAQTAISLPHVTPPGAVGPAAVNTDISFYPTGEFYSATLLYNRPDFTLDGFPFLLEGFQLNNVPFDPWTFPYFYPGGAAPLWNADATAVNPPANNWNQRGFVELKGAIITPYFGPLQGPASQPRPNIFVLGWDPYMGFTSTLRAEKVWVDLDLVKITFDYDKLVYAYDAEAQRGMFAGFKNYKLVPDDVVPPLPSEAQVLNLDTGVVMEPDLLGVYLGQASAIASARALAEHQNLPLGSPPDANTLSVWYAKLAVVNPVTYTTLLNNVWSTYGARTYTDTVAVLNDYELAPNTNLPDDPLFGGSTMGKMDEWGVKLSRMRGLVEMTGTGLDYQFERFLLSLQLRVQQSGDKDPRLYAELISMEINRHGDFILIGRNISSQMIQDLIKRMDISLRINPVLPQFEGGFTGYEMLSKANPRIEQLTVVIGVGAEVNYIGGEFEGVASGTGKVRLGGSLLVGTIKPNSPVLQTHFKELMDKLSEIPGSGDQLFTGFYLRAHGQTPIFGASCLLQVTAGAEVAGWYWSIAGNQGDAWGGKMRGYVFGSFICLVSLRGDITLEYAQQTFNNETVRTFIGDGWVAGGLGFCDADGWKSWQTRWWDQPFCWTAGARLQIKYREGPGGPTGWDVNYTVEFE
ncbi:MAG TPA: hypothetical protein PKZ84_02585 [Anaerolineae bacterium]|nr:hypothetical protein [Anaerolineae bacterium]HQI85998.1 hypothetical protein [Anaerolineae bacterium]